METHCYTYVDIPGRAAWITLQDAEEELETILKTFPKKTTVALTPERGYFIDSDGALRSAPVAEGTEIAYSQAKNRREYVGLDWRALRSMAKQIRVWLALPPEDRPFAQIG